MLFVLDMQQGKQKRKDPETWPSGAQQQRCNDGQGEG